MIVTDIMYKISVFLFFIINLRNFSALAFVLLGILLVLVVVVLL